MWKLVSELFRAIKAKLLLACLVFSAEFCRNIGRILNSMFLNIKAGGDTNFVPTAATRPRE
jgi:hypothetical protein